MPKNKEKNETFKEILKINSELIRKMFESYENEKNYLKDKLQKSQYRYSESRLYISNMIFKLFDDIQEKHLSEKDILKHLIGIMGKI